MMREIGVRSVCYSTFDSGPEIRIYRGSVNGTSFFTPPEAAIKRDWGRRTLFGLRVEIGRFFVLERQK